MKKQTPTIEWVVIESDAEWERLCPMPIINLAAEPNRRLRRQRTFLSMATLLLLLVGAVSVTISTHDAPVAKKSSQPAAVAQQFSAKVAMNRSDQGSENGASPDYVFEVVQNFAIQSERKVAHVLLYGEHGEPLYRQTRFYQRIGPDWRPTEPVAALLGAQQQLTTPHFVFYFRHDDAQTVIAVAPQIETLYTVLQGNLGLPSAPAGQKLVIDVRVTMLPDDAPTQPRDAGHISVLSPVLYLAPVGLTDAQLLHQSIVLPLLDYLLTQAILTHGLAAGWRPMRQGIYLWQLWNLDLPLAAWREEVVTWLYHDAANTDSAQVIRLPAQYQALCTIHKLWMASPVQIGIPFWCNELDQQQAALLWWGEHIPATHLAQLAVPIRPHAHAEIESVTDLVSYPGQTVELATLIEYAVATYGRERLPALMTGLGQYQSWETLIPAVYGVSVAEFETGWQAYLVAHYAVDPATFRQ